MMPWGQFANMLATERGQIRPVPNLEQTSLVTFNSSRKRSRRSLSIICEEASVYIVPGVERSCLGGVSAAALWTLI